MVKLLQETDKDKFLKNLHNELKSDNWKSIKKKLEELLIKTYMEYDNLKSYEEFLGKQAEIKTLKKIVYMDRYKNWGGQVPLRPASSKLGSC